MNPRHHPSEATLTAYAAGALKPGFALVVAAHLDRCAQCRSMVRTCETVGGALLADVAGAPMGEGALSALMEKLDAPAAPARPARVREPLDQRLPIGVKRWAAPGVWVAPVLSPHAPEDRIYLLSVPAKGATAKHSHSGMEFTYVVSGALKDGDAIFEAGDFLELDESVTHHPQVHGDEPCVCLFATEGRLKAASWVGGLAFMLADV